MITDDFSWISVRQKETGPVALISFYRLILVSIISD